MDFSKYIADRVLEIPRSGIRDFFEVVQTMSDVISLGIGEPDYVTPWRIREAAIFAMEKGQNWIHFEPGHAETESRRYRSISNADAVSVMTRTPRF